MTQDRFSHHLEQLKELRQTFQGLCRNDVPGLLAARTYAQNFLDLLQRAFSDAAVNRSGWSLAAVGGFGRGELSYASDLDLLFLYKGRLPPVLEEIVQELFYGLWDGGFEVGHVTASISEIRQLVRQDFSVLTNYLEARFIAGDEGLYTSWRRSFYKDLGSQRRRKSLQDLIRYRQDRLFRYGESSYLLEPHVKEGVGGLRDLHTIRWTAAVLLQDTTFDALIRQDWLTSQEELWLEQAYDFLWRVRLQLHQLTGRRQDNLLFPEQEQLAGRLGFVDGPQGSAVEAFMRFYYRHTARVRRTASFFLDRVEEAQNKIPSLHVRRRIFPGPFLLEGRHLHFLEPEWVKDDPRILMRFFWQAAKAGAHFHHQTGRVIRENLDAFGDAARRDPEVIRQFTEVLLHPEHSFPVLKVMLETGFLIAFLPEFAAIRYKVQHDVYHLYTVDEHLLRTVRELHEMERRPEESLASLGLGDIFVQLKHRNILFFAALLHDIGKGIGKRHAERGASMARNIVERLGFNSQESDLLVYLIEKHLILAETALKRDLMDEKPILRCAIEVGDRERLQMLYLLTIADSRATGPGAWSTWKASLLRELYSKVDRQLLRGDWKGEDVQRRAEAAQEKALALAGSASDRSRIAEWLNTLSFRYLLSQNPEDILRHYYLEKALEERSLVLDTQKIEGEMWQVTVATRDRPGLFSIITGVLWACGLNILSADIFTRQSGIAVDILIVESLPDPLRDRELWEKVENDLAECLKSRSYLAELLANKRKPSLLHQKALPRREDRVLIDEEASDFYTVVEVYTWDRPGVLHAISNALFELGASIQLAKISTPGAQVADIFYVTDLVGNKLQESEIHEKVRRHLLGCLQTVG